MMQYRLLKTQMLAVSYMNLCWLKQRSLCYATQSWVNHIYKMIYVFQNDTPPWIAYDFDFTICVLKANFFGQVLPLSQVSQLQSVKS